MNFPPGEVRTRDENDAARQFFENHRAQARKWWEERNRRAVAVGFTHDHHPRELVNGGDPLFVEPSFGDSGSEHTRDSSVSRGEEAV